MAEDIVPLGEPWRAAGLDERRAAAHLLSRLTYGPRPGDLDRIVATGLGPWLEEQLAGHDPGAGTRTALERLPGVVEGPADGSHHYPHHAAVVAEAIAAGRLSREAYGGEKGEAERRAAQAALDRWAAEQGYRPMGDLLAEIRGQRLLRAVGSKTQLREMLTDFWFNHFNVTALHGETRIHVWHYVLETLRPSALGHFEDLLQAVARHPAMLLYLGNARSAAAETVRTTFDHLMATSPPTPLGEQLARRLGWRPIEDRRQTPSPRGLNENYARELLELHTLGVEGGYSQADVVAVARAFSGWTVLPKGAAGASLRALWEKARSRGETRGLVVDGAFLFRPDHHDAEPKTVLGRALPPGRGIDDGLDVLRQLAAHPSTARHLARKLAIRFVADDPPASLVDRLTIVWQRDDGNVAQVMRELVRSPEFWRATGPGHKIKTPFELVSSALRVVDARVDDPRPAMAWVSRAGESAYTYAVPTGHGDRRADWLGVGALLARANFAFLLARRRLPGIEYSLDGLLATLAEDHPLLAPGDARAMLYPEDALAALFPEIFPTREPGPALEELMIWSAPIDPGAFELYRPEELPAPPTAGPDSPADEKLPNHPDPPGDEAAEARSDTRRREGLLYYALGLLLASPMFQER